ncbi:MAG: SH3 domain-containing protein [Synergistales bacterium]|nr:SH3 domain-containing protein [Synergistales bacterium]
MKLSRSNKRTLPSLLITLFIVSLSVSGIACAAEVREAEVSNEIQDVLELPQNPFFYLSGDYNKRLISEEEQQDHLREFMKLYFSPWSQSGPRHGMDVHDWIFQHFGEKQGYGENLRPRSGEWLEGQKINSNFQAFRSLDRKAISVRGTDLRLLPTDRPFFYDPALPGEGFPFDHLQNSGVHGGEPLFISHLSKDGAWAWSETSYAAGWIRVEDLAFVNEEFMEKWMSLPLGVVTSDKSPLTDEEGLFRFMGTIGTILPITDRGIAKNRVLLPVRDTDGKAIVKTALLDVEHFRVHPLPFTSWNAAMVCEGLINNPYGWGGYLENRDCSSTIRDILLPFGIWMPRNSGAQAKTGLTISLEGMERSEKIRAILREATPFSTLVNKRGHVMLYIGYYHGRPVILHNTWGIGTLEEGSERRHIIGKTVLTTLEPGKELDHLHPDKGLLIDSITGITLLGGIR